MRGCGGGRPSWTAARSASRRSWSAATWLCAFLVSHAPPLLLAPVPPDTASVSSLKLADQDLDAGQVGGPITWTPPADVSTVAQWDVYLASSALGAGRSQVGSGVPVGTNTAALAIDFPASTYDYILVYARNADGQQIMPSAELVTDASVSVTGIGIVDLDIDNVEIGGDVTWTPPADASRVASYQVYLAADAAGGSRSFLGAAPVGTNMLFVPADTSRIGLPRLAVYTKSVLGEQTTPATGLVNDQVAILTSMTFVDRDLDASELGGHVSWTAMGGGLSVVSKYNVYFAFSSLGAGKMLVGSAPVGTNDLLIGPDLQQGDNLFVLVYIESTLAEATGNAAIGVFDIVASVSNVQFPDLDLDPLELGGYVTWDPPMNADQVTYYRMYLAEAADGTNKTFQANYSVGTNQGFVPPNTSLAAYEHIVVYTQSSLVEQSTPVGQPLFDVVRNVSDVFFIDLDLDEAEFGGTVTWEEPALTSFVAFYSAYLAETDNGTGRSYIGDVAEGTNTITLNADQPAASFGYVVVYTKSSLTEQTTPVGYNITDNFATASGLNITDEDLDPLDYGGTATWENAQDMTYVWKYVVYLGNDAAGSGRLKIGGELDNSTNTLFIPPDKSPPVLLVYTKSSFVEQTTPAAFAISDSTATVVGFAFHDKDLDAGDLGGMINFTQSGDLHLVDRYIVFIGEDAIGTGRSQIGPELAVTTEKITVPTETITFGSHSHVLVYARSFIAEQTTPAVIPYAAISDAASDVINVRFFDKDLDPLQIGGHVEWQPPLDTTQVLEYLVYLSGQPYQTMRSQLGSAIALGTNDLVVLDESPITADQTLLLVYSKSTMFEQTTPVISQLNDSDAAVDNVTYIDKDLDELEIGGIVGWKPATDVSQITSYNVYLAVSAGDGAERSLVGSVPVGTNEFHFADTNFSNFSFVAVYSQTSFAEGSRAKSAPFTDIVAQVSGTAFIDRDMDDLELGGLVTWSAPADVSQVTAYLVYLSDSPEGSARSQLQTPVPVGTNEFAMLPDTPMGPYSHLVVYARSSFVEQTTPDSFVIVPVSQSIKDLRFPDRDLDDDELGGTIAWSPPNDTTLVTHYVTYLAASPVGTGRSIVGQVAEGTYSTELPPGTAVASFTHVVVYTKTALAEQTTPVALAISDTGGTVLTAEFVDKDLDAGELGGFLSWTLPADVAFVANFSVHLATSAAGAGRSQLGAALAPDVNVTAVPENLAKGAFTHVVVYSQSTLVEQTTPAFVQLSDASTGITGVVFIDRDLDGAELGGHATWDQPTDTTQVVDYLVYLATDAAGASKTLAASVVPSGTNTAWVPAETPLAAFSHLVVFARSALFEQTTPGAVALVDMSSTVSGTIVVDKDLDALEFGGDITWSPPADTNLVTHYAVHLAEDAAGLNRSLIGAEVPVGTTTIHLPAETARRDFSHVLVYTRSSFVEQTTPFASVLVDTHQSASGLAFIDQDLDEDEVGGATSWTEPSATSQVQDYVLYLASSADGGVGRRLIQAGLTPGSTTTAIPQNTPLGNATHAILYTRSSLVEQTTPAAVQFSDTVSPVRDVLLVDEDFDALQFGGTATWRPPTEAAQVTAYVVYFSADAVGGGRSQVGADVAVGTIVQDVPSDTAKGSFTHLVVYAKSVFCEQTTPVAFALNDTALTVSDVLLVDKDLDAGELGGAVTWRPPLDESLVTYYVVYLATNASGDGRVLADNTTVVGSNVAEVQPDTPLSSHDVVVVYIRSGHSEQSMPASSPSISDAISTVSSVAFVDKDLDADDVAGEVLWAAPADVSQVTQYVIYLSDATGRAERSQVELPVAFGTNKADVPVDTNASTLVHLAVFTRSSLVEQSTPAVLAISDAASTVSGIAFPDKDLDAAELGGLITWAPPADVSQVAQYVIYLAGPGTGGNRSLVAVGVPLGTNEASLSVETAQGALTHVLVYTKSSLAEQTTPGALPISDTSASASAVEFSDFDLDVAEFGGDLNFTAPSDTSFVTHYAVYFSATPDGGGRSQIGPELPVGTTETVLPPEIAANSFAHAAVFARSALAEQTTPATVALVDRVAGAASIDFPDQDLDAGELGGNIYWQPSGELALIENFTVYVANGGTRLLLGVAPAGTNQLFLDQNFDQAAWQQIHVLAVSKLAERTVPDALNIADSNSTVSALAFLDQDVDVGELGGTVTWAEPADFAEVASYAVYAATDAVGSGRSKIGVDVQNGTAQGFVPPDLPQGAFTHFVVYSRSSLFEQTTPEAVRISDTGLRVTGIVFPDADLDALEVGGNVTWQPPNPDAMVTAYVVYVASSVGGADRSQVSVESPGTTSTLVPADTALSNYTHVAVYIRTSTAEQTVPSSLEISDTAQSVSDITFVDLDLDSRELGGSVKWLPAPNEALVTGYEVYIAAGADGASREITGSAVSGANSSDMAADTQVGGRGFIVVYARSDLAEQTTPVSAVINDTSASVSSPELVDWDLDLGDLGGVATWAPPSEPELNLVTGYAVYLALEANGTGRSIIATTLPVGTNTLNVPADTAAGASTHLVVYARSALAEQSTPVAAALNDTSSDVRGLTFVDLDLDADELGASVNWQPPADATLVVAYVAYLAEGAAGENRSLIGAEVAFGTNAVDLPPDSPQLAFTHFVVYAKSDLAEQTTPVSLVLNDTASTVSSVTFDDLDLDELELGGVANWTEPADASQVVDYVFYFAGAAGGAGRSQVGPATPAGGASTTTAGDLALGAFAHALVYTRSALAEQSTPASAPINDTASSVSGVNFTDVDLDAAEVGGTVVWQEPADSQHVLGYVMYLATSGAGAGRSQLGALVSAPSTSSVFGPDVALGAFTHVVIYARSALFEQTTPTSFALTDTSSSVRGVVFVERDLDEDELGGRVTWDEPVEISQVTHYVAYLASGAGGEGRSKIGADIPIGTNFIDLPPETPMANFSYVAVYAKSAIAEESTPQVTLISDAASTVSAVVFPDEDLDGGELGGTAVWTPPGNDSQVTGYLVYVAANASGYGRSLIGSEVPVGTNVFAIPENTPADAALVVYARSALVEQTTPGFLGASDSSSTVTNVTFIDKDLDAGDMGGTVSWEEPADKALVTSYVVYRSTSAAGAGRSSLFNDVPLGTNEGVVAPELAIGHFAHIAVYSRSAAFEQTTPAAVAISDSVAVVGIAAVVDRDLDATDFGGEVQWSPPADVSQVTRYILYMAEDAAGAARVHLGADVAVGTNEAVVAPEKDLANFTHVLVFTTSSLVEQTTPAALLVSDMVADVANVGFTDRDLDAADLGGAITWTPPADASRVTAYVAYLAQSALGAGRWQVDAPAVVGSNSVDLAPDTTLAPFTHTVVYSRSSLVEQTTPAFQAIVDRVASVFGVAFTDLDLDPLQVGGTVTWSAPADNALVTHYVLYVAATSDGGNRSQVGADVPVGTQLAAIPAELDLGIFATILVYTRSSLAEQTTPTALTIVDQARAVSGIVFPDRDLDGDELGGRIVWTPPANMALVDRYQIYLSETDTGSNRSLIGAAIPAGTNAIDLPPEQPLRSYTHVVVFVASSLVEQTTPVALAISDSSSSVVDVDFVDKDLDAGEIGGDVFWQPSNDSAEVFDHVVYLAASPVGASRSLLGAVPNGTDDVRLPGDFSRGIYTHVVVYARSLLVEQTTPVAFSIGDTDSSVTGVGFVDKDLDLLELGGAVTWTTPAESSQVQRYFVYLASSAAGANRSQIGAPVPNGTEVHHLPPEQPLDAYTHVAVYTESSLFEQTTPVAFAISDVFSLVTDVELVDKDLDPLDLGGQVTWTSPSESSQVTYYLTYFAEDQVGGGRWLLGSPVPAGTNTITVPVDFTLGNFTHVVVYTRSSLVEQTTPQWFLINDTNSSVRDIVFPDQDLDADEFGGTVSWSEPYESSQVTFYAAYLAESATGANRSQIGDNVTFGAEQQVLPYNQSEDDYTHVVVYTMSSLTEQTTPTFLAISDTGSYVSGMSLLDLDLDGGDLGGPVTWLPPDDNPLTTHYDVYLATDAAGTGRSRIGTARPVGTNAVDLEPDTTTLPFTHVVVYTRSAMAEQTTPVAFAISDTTESVSSIGFIDRDLDERELGGTITWNPPVNDSLVTNYDVYLSANETGANRSQVDVPLAVGTHLVQLLPNEPLAIHEYVVVYTRSSLLEQTTPVYNVLNDTIASVSNIFFTDLDFDERELGGNITWVDPPDMSQVLSFAIYLAREANGTGRSQMLTDVPAGENLIHLAPERALDQFEQILVYTRSTLLEQTTPVAFDINDTYLVVSGITFPDKDLDAGELGGTVSWTEPPNTTLVTHYLAYYAETPEGAGRSQIDADIAVGTNQAFATPDVANASFRVVVVYVRSALVEQTTPVSINISDTIASVSSIAFIDKDLDVDDLGGTISWAEPPDMLHVTFYLVYFAEDAVGAGRYQLKADVPALTADIVVDEDHTKGNSTHIAIYTRSSLLEQTTPVSFLFSDTYSFVNNVNFVDLDLDLLDLGGTVTWDPSTEQSQVTRYAVYLSTSSAGTNLSQIGQDVPVNETETVFLPPDQDLADFTDIVVYVASSLYEQTTPVAFLINDTEANVSDLEFVDRDLDGTQLGGTIYWRPRGDQDLVTHFAVYLSTTDYAVVHVSSDGGAGRSQHGPLLSPQTHEVDIDPDYWHAPNRHILVYTKSSLTEQTTPVSFLISDAAWSVSSVNLLDRDLDEGQIGGTITWVAPYEVRLVTHYLVYLAEDAAGARRSQVSVDLPNNGSLPEGTNETELALDKELDNFTHIVVYTRSSLLEQTTPVAHNISDVISIVPQVNFTDRDLDTEEIGGDIFWLPPPDVSQVTSYAVYLAENSTGSQRSQIAVDVPVGTNTLHLPPEKALELYSHIVVYTRSAFGQLTTPTALAISDTIASVEDVDFVDKDLDDLEIGGTVYWNATGDLHLVTHYAVYLTSNATAEAVRSRVQDSVVADIPPTAAAEIFIVPDLDPPLSTYDWVAVFTSSSLAERTTPVAIQISDTFSPVSDVVFIDRDLDIDDLGGNVTWTEPTDVGQVTFYLIYLAEDAAGNGRSKIGADIPLGTEMTFLPPEQTMGNLSFVSVYTRSSLLESTTPVSAPINDTRGVVTIEFFDQDLDVAQMGGNITWSIPESVALVTEYYVYFATSTTGGNRSQVDVAVPVDTNVQPFASEFYFAPYTHVVVYTSSSLVEQTTPGFLELTDIVSSISGLVFVDKDLDELELGGTILWQEPAEASQVTEYVAYLATGPAGAGRSQVNSELPDGYVPRGTNHVKFPPELPLANLVEVAVYTKSVLVEQSTPITIPVVDTQSRVSNVGFVDIDQDLDRLGGDVTWTLPPEYAQVTKYVIYLAAGNSATYGGARRQELVANPTDTTAFLPLNTPQSESAAPSKLFELANQTALYDFILVYTNSSLVEQTTPAGTFAEDFCQKIPALENNTVTPEEGVNMLDARYYQHSLLLEFSHVTADGARLKYIALRKGKMYVMVAPMDRATGLDSTSVSLMHSAAGGPGCRIVGQDVVSCLVLNFQLNDCQLPIGGGALYRLFILIVGENETVASVPAAHIDYFVASNYFVYGPEIVRREEDGLTTVFMPSQDGVAWSLLATTEDGSADYIGPPGREWTGRNEAPILRIKSAGDPALDKYLYGGTGCSIVRAPITAKLRVEQKLTNCSLKLGKNYRLFVYIEGTTDANDGTLRVFDFTYFGIITLDSGIPFSMPIPLSELWRIVPKTAVAKEWRVQRLRFFSDIACTDELAAYPAPYRDLFQITVGEDTPLPNGAPFSLPGPLPGSHEAFGDGPLAGDTLSGWTSGRPCDADECHIGFSFGSASDGPAAARREVQVGCAEVVQSTAAGEFATGLQLQYWRADVGFVPYRTRGGLGGGSSFVPEYRSTREAI